METLLNSKKLDTGKSVTKALESYKNKAMAVQSTK